MNKQSALKLEPREEIILKKNAKKIYPHRVGGWGKELNSMLGEKVKVNTVYHDGVIKIFSNEIIMPDSPEIRNIFLLPYECLEKVNK